MITDRLGDINLEDSHGLDSEGGILEIGALEPLQENSAQPHEPRKPSKWETVYQNTKHSAGGLVSHPFESIKQLSIFRHCHGLVFYKGPLTHIAITIFSDQPLPADRTL